MDPGHLLESAVTFLHRSPSLWPVAFCLLFFPILLAVSRSRSLRTRFAKAESRILLIWGIGVAGILAFCALAYLGSPAFFDFFESTGVSVAYTAFHGGVAYPETSSAERYCLPYGPALYLVLGASQWVFGASTFSSKLPCCVAAVLAIALFWRILRSRGLSAVEASTLAGLNAACMLGLRQVVFWTRSDPLISLAVTAGIWAAFRRTRLGPVVLGACIGLGLSLKITAGIYFLPVVVIAFYTGWSWRDFAICGAVLLSFVVLPFALFPTQFPWRNYMAFFRTVGHEGFAQVPAAGFFRWGAMLAGLLFVADHFILQHATLESRRQRWAYRGALAAGFAIVAVPACAVGAGQHHLLPFIPLVLLAFGDLFANREIHPWRYSAHPFWRAAAYAIFFGSTLVAIQTARQIVKVRAEIDGQSRLCEADLRQILTSHTQWTILMGTGLGYESDVSVRLRHLVVFAGNPIGLDAAVVSDYQFGGIAAPDLPRLLTEIRRRNPRPVLWLLSRGASPFTSTNWYDSHLQIYPEHFRRDFSELFQLRESTRFFDLYLPTKSE